MNNSTKLLLPLNLQYFAEEKPTETNPVDTTHADTKVDASDTPIETVKTFTQSELDEILAKRIERERKKYADYDDVKAQASEYAKELEAKRQAELSEVERAQEVAKQYEEEKQSLATQLETIKKQAEQERIKNAFAKAASKADIEYVDDALTLADLSKVIVDEDGSVSGIDEVVASLVEAKPFLLKKKTPQEIGQTMNVSGTAANTKSPDALLTEARNKAKQSGRIEDRIAYDKLKRELGK